MAGRGTLKFERNMSADRGFTLIKFGGYRSRDRNFEGRKSAKSEQI